MRSDNAAIHAQHKMEPSILKSPFQQIADSMESDQKLRIRAGIMAQLNKR